MGRVLSSRYIIIDPTIYTRAPVVASTPVAVEPRKASQAVPIDGSKEWAELHRRALTWRGGMDGFWLTQFRLRVPCGECRKHWDEMQARTPPDWPHYFGWTVARHNEVNARLGKPALTEAEARIRWLELPVV